MTTQTETRIGAPTKAVQTDPTQAPTEPPKDRLVCKSEVLHRISLTYPTVWKMMRAGTFPRAVELGGKTAWYESEIDRWIATRPVRVLKGDNPKRV